MNSPFVFHTRPSQVSRGLTQELAKFGLDSGVFEVINLRFAPNFSEQLKQSGYFEQLLFVSPSSVVLAWPVLRDYLQSHLNLVNNPQLWCIGESTALALKESWLADPLQINQKPVLPWPILKPLMGHDSLALLSLPEFKTVLGLRVGIVTGSSGGVSLTEKLLMRGAIVTRLEAYHTDYLRPNWAVFLEKIQQIELAEPSMLFCVVTSSQIAHHLINTVPDDLRQHWLNTTMIVLHPRIEMILRQAGAKHVMLTKANDKAIVARILSCINRA